MSDPTLVIGLGNPILRDDGVGIAVVRRLRARLGPRRDVVFDEDTHGGLRLMERMVGYRRVVVVDAICIDAPPGTVVELTPSDLPTAHSASTHDMTLATALALGRRAGATLPTDEDVRLVGVQAADLTSFGESCTPQVEDAFPRATGYVEAILDAWSKPRPNGRHGATP